MSTERAPAMESSDNNATPTPSAAESRRRSGRVKKAPQKYSPEVEVPTTKRKRARENDDDGEEDGDEDRGHPRRPDPAEDADDRREDEGEEDGEDEGDEEVAGDVEDADDGDADVDEARAARGGRAGERRRALPAL